MSCTGLQKINPICQAKSAAQDAAESAFTHMAQTFGSAAQDATNWLWSQINSATTVDLHHLGDSKPLAATAAIAIVLCLGLFLLQVITSTLRREPGGLGRAAKGLLISLLGSAFALSVTVLFLAAVDSLSEGVVRYTMGTNLQGLGDRLAIAHLSGVTNPAAVLLFAIVILGAVVVVWAALMVRKMMILIAAVLAPLAFAGATADITRSWVRKWIEFIAAMIASKLLLVIIFSIGISVLDGYGQHGGGVAQATTQLAVGSLILLLGGFAPWVAIKTFHFAGDSLYAAHATAAGGSAGARTVIAAPQKAAMMHSQVRALGGGPRAQGNQLTTAQPRIHPEQVGATSPTNTPSNRSTGDITTSDASSSVGSGNARAPVRTSPSVSINSSAGANGATGAASSGAAAAAPVGAAAAGAVTAGQRARRAGVNAISNAAPEPRDRKTPRKDPAEGGTLPPAIPSQHAPASRPDPRPVPGSGAGPQRPTPAAPPRADPARRADTSRSDEPPTPPRSRP